MPFGGPSGRCNRVRPDGSLVATTDRGLLWGNRGALLDRDGSLVRHSRGRGWVVCLLEFRGRRRVQWQPGRLTELYFLDEATAFAAGHRPCGECRNAAYREFTRAWAAAHLCDEPGARHLDARLAADRLEGTGPTHRTYQAELTDLPDGVLVRLGTHDAWLVLGDQLLAWTTAGYTTRQRRSEGEVSVLTPRSTVAALAAGYRPILHPSSGHQVSDN